MNILSDPRLGIGGNSPPALLDRLAIDHERLFYDVEGLAARATQMPKKISADADLDIVGSLLIDARSIATRSELARKAAKEPSLREGRDIDGFFKTKCGERLERIISTFQKIADAYVQEKADRERRAAQAAAERAREEENRRLMAAAKAEADHRQRHAGQHVARAEEAAAKAEAAEMLAAASSAELTRARTESGLLSTAKDEWAFAVADYAAVDLEALRPYLPCDVIDKAIRLAIKQGRRDIRGVRIYPQAKAAFRR